MIQIQSPHYADLDFLDLHQAFPERYPFLLESVAHGSLGAFDILFAYPQHTITCQNLEDAAGFIEKFNQAFLQTSLPSSLADDLDEHLPFRGGWFGYFSYDYANVVEPSLNLPMSDLPLATLTRMPAALIKQHATESLFLLAEFEFQTLLPQIEADIASVLAVNHAPQATKTVNSSVILSASEEPETKYLSGVEAIKDYILSGDNFQVNLSREWSVALDGDNYADVYRALRKHNPAPFAACVHFGDWQLLSSSPERLVKYQHPWVETRPIAGTRKRSTDALADQALIDELISHPKERAEHIMLIDLERNDLGRICQPGTVEVNELMVVETYEHVHHIVSNIRGKLQAGMLPLDIIHAVFPGGTITGCPKVRCMEIIAELEQMPRKAYTGSLGYINHDGSLDFNILIRTMLMQGNQVTFRAGAGIVADSIADKELEETRHKAKGLINALNHVKFGLSSK
ncbi:aminodeoxychorismate synthase component I [Thiosulfativibrio zosterae]|uniref:aminodeoxychorismate synthase component I n=1 Tax=Thiosulfativibrio zosterae TaxID=2675053 RepID=UPI001FB8FFAD|nr:aminodeoxychorismate synthase component I [Thiosulfativibrio zosterae]